MVSLVLIYSYLGMQGEDHCKFISGVFVFHTETVVLNFVTA